MTPYTLYSKSIVLSSVKCLLEDMNSFPNLTVIGNNAFAGCTNITAADLPHVTTVGNGAFSGCKNLSAVNLPNAVSIAKDAFEGCPKLTTPEPPNDNACIDGFRKCSDNKQEAWRCQNGKWIAAETCANSCANGHCIPDAPTQACTNGALKCSDDNTAVQICKNTRWITLTDCPNGCTNGSCNGKPEMTCTEGETKCSQDNTHTLICTDNQWMLKEKCESSDYSQIEVCLRLVAELVDLPHRMRLYQMLYFHKIEFQQAGPCNKKSNLLDRPLAFASHFPYYTSLEREK
ncbi:MAG: leucine-rich repeat protein [Proteobacteria bacterium]|nr:leucine-rich repeat protein [Pseudomonadota bacterium]